MDEIRQSLTNEWKYKRRKEINELFYRQLLAKYDVQIQRPEWAGGGTKENE